MAELTKKKAIELVVEYEKKQGRNPEVVNKRKFGYNIKSGDRFIDVKIGSKRGDLLVSFTAFKNLGKSISNYYIYVLKGDEEKPRMQILEPEFILQNFNLLTLINIKANSTKKIPELDLKSEISSS